MLAKEIAIKKDLFCRADWSLKKVYRMMLDYECFCLPVVETLAHKNLIGAVTEHEICLKIIQEGLNPAQLFAEEVMNCHLTIINGFASLDECLDLVKFSRNGRIFVVDENRKYAGMLEETYLQAFKNQLLPGKLSNGYRVKRIASNNLHTAPSLDIQTILSTSP